TRRTGPGGENAGLLVVGARRAGQPGETPEDWSVMCSLRPHAVGRPTSPGALASDLELSSGAMTSRLDRLEKLGRIRRLRADADARLRGARAHRRRQVESVLAPAGAEARIARARPERMERLGLALSLDAVRDVVTERRPVLETVPRPAAGEPPRRMLRVPADDEMRVGREVVLADARPDHGRAGESGEPRGHVVACVLQPGRQRDPVERIGVDGVAREVGR